MVNTDIRPANWQSDLANKHSNDSTESIVSLDNSTQAGGGGCALTMAARVSLASPAIAPLPPHCFLGGGAMASGLGSGHGSSVMKLVYGDPEARGDLFPGKAAMLGHVERFE